MKLLPTIATALCALTVSAAAHAGCVLQRQAFDNVARIAAMSEICDGVKTVTVEGALSLAAAAKIVDPAEHRQLSCVNEMIDARTAWARQFRAFSKKDRAEFCAFVVTDPDSRSGLSAMGLLR